MPSAKNTSCLCIIITLEQQIHIHDKPRRFPSLHTCILYQSSALLCSFASQNFLPNMSILIPKNRICNRNNSTHCSDHFLIDLPVG